MEESMKEKIKETVTEILKNADMQEMTEFKVRTLAADKLGIDLSDPPRKMFVRQVVESFLQELHQKSIEAARNDAVEGSEVEQRVDEEEQEEEDDKRRSDGKEYDDDGDLIICRLSEKRRVTIQDFRGRTLVSIREYYKKDGKYLPTSKGISLTAEQWSTFKKNVSAIEKAVEKMEARSN